MHYDKDKIKQQLTLEQVAEVVVALGGAYPFVSNTTLKAETLCHNLPGEANGFKLYYYENSKLFHCYTECHESFDVFQLVQKAMEIQYSENWDLPKCVIWVAQKFGIAGEMEGFDGDKIDDWKIINRQNAIQNKIEQAEKHKEVNLVEYDGSILTKLPFLPIEGWMREGITLETLKRYGIKYYPKDGKIVIPHWDESSKLVGIRGRSMVALEAELFGKYMPIKINGIMYAHPLSFALYGLNFNKENITKIKKAIIFEGE